MKKSLLLTLFLLNGCMSYKIPTEQLAQERNANEMQMRCAQNRIYNYIPMKKEQLQKGDLRWASWYFLGNDSGGIFGEYDYFKDKKEPSFKTFLEWQARNPLHNATRLMGDDGSGQSKSEYILLGLSDEDIALFRNTKRKDFEQGEHNLFLALHNYKPYLHTVFYVPFTQRNLQFYIGWRKGGKFGSCLRLRKETK